MISAVLASADCRLISSTRSSTRISTRLISGLLGELIQLDRQFPGGFQCTPIVSGCGMRISQAGAPGLYARCGAERQTRSRGRRYAAVANGVNRFFIRVGSDRSVRAECRPRTSSSAFVQIPNYFLDSRRGPNLTFRSNFELYAKLPGINLDSGGTYV